ncbi:MAG TPA: ABC transporter permease [Alphaproteobacteria bacterium]|nr:ABC transporter permease [Alphaproteobacteria bacterium]
MFRRLKEYQFLLEELTKRDFRKKYKRTVLGVFWSVLSPLLTLFVMKLVFTNFFGRNTEFYTTYLFAGNLIFSYFRESTTLGMSALMNNADIFSKINIPKYMFVLSSNVSSLINFMVTLVVFFVFAAIDGITFSWRFLVLIYPTVCLLIFNVGVGLILSAMYVFFRDTQYLYSVFTLLLMYMSAIFYQVTSFPVNVQRLFLLNPVYVFIKYFRVIVIDGNIPSIAFNLLPLFWAAAAMLIGGLIYKKNNQRFMYYV